MTTKQVQTTKQCQICSQGVIPGMEFGLHECSRCGKEVCTGCSEAQNTGDIVCHDCTEVEHGDTV